MRQALGWDLAPPRTRRPKSSTSSIVRSTRALPIRRSRRGLPNRAALRLRARPPTTASSLPTKPRSGARWSSSRTSNRSDPAPIFHNLPFRESQRRGDRVTVGALLAPAPPTNLSDARGIRGTPQKLNPRPPPGFSPSSARSTPTTNGRTDVRLVDDRRRKDFRALCLKPLGKSGQGREDPQTDPQS